MENETHDAATPINAVTPDTAAAPETVAPLVAEAAPPPRKPTMAEMFAPKKIVLPPPSVAETATPPAETEAVATDVDNTDDSSPDDDMSQYIKKPQEFAAENNTDAGAATDESAPGIGTMAGNMISAFLKPKMLVQGYIYARTWLYENAIIAPLSHQKTLQKEYDRLELIDSAVYSTDLQLALGNRQAQLRRQIDYVTKVVTSLKEKIALPPQYLFVLNYHAEQVSTSSMVQKLNVIPDWLITLGVIGWTEAQSLIAIYKDLFKQLEDIEAEADAQFKADIAKANSQTALNKTTNAEQTQTDTTKTHTKKPKRPATEGANEPTAANSE